MSTSMDHQHGRTCYWDHLRCGWVCPAPAPAVPAPERDADSEPGTEPTTAPQAVVG